MSFSTEIKKSESEKFSLVRLSYSSLLSKVSLGSNLFSVSTNDYIFELYCDDVKLTKVSGVPSSGQYSVSDDLKTATFYSSNLDPTVIGRFYLYVTNDKNRAIGRDPTLPNLDIIEWSGRLKNNPSFSQSIENLQTGTITMSVSEIQLINHDGKYNFLMDYENYVNNMLFDVWFCCNGVENIVYGFSGLSVEVSNNANTLTIKTKDTLDRLEKKCFMGDSESECYFDTDAGGAYFGGDPSKNKRPIPFLTGKTTDYKIKNIIIFGALRSSFESDSLREAFCSAFSATISTSTNREFLAYRTNDVFDVYESALCVANMSGGYDFTLSSEDVASYFLYGDTFKHGTSYFRVLSVFQNVVTASLESGPVPSSLAIFDMYAVPVVIIERDGVFYNCVYGRDYDVSGFALPSGNVVCKITFKNNFEATAGVPSALNPTEDIVRFRAHNKTINHDEAARRILEDANIKCSFSGTYSSALVCFGIPAINESDFGMCLVYLEKILQSNTSFIFQSASGDFDYNEFSSPLSTTVITEDDYILGSLRIEENSQDIYTSATFSQESIVGESTGYSSSTLETLVGTKKSGDFISVNYDTSPKNATLSKLFKKTNSFLLSTKKIGYDFTLGEFIEIKNKKLTVVSLQKSVDKIDIVANDAYTY